MPRGGFTVCQHIHYKKIIPYCRRIGVDTLFTPHANGVGKPSWKERVRHCFDRVSAWLRGDSLFKRAFRVLPFPHVAVNGSQPAAHKDLLYSFIGFLNHTTREVILALPERSDAVILRRHQWHFDGRLSRRETERQQYQDVLARSRFSLCPRGTGPSSIRFWESLQAESIPVLIADAMQLPEGFDWD